MSRQGFSIEKWLEITGENESRGDGIKLLPVSAAPGGDTGPQDEAGIGSLAMHTTTGAIYKKIANAGALADWDELTSTVAVTSVWRNELVRISTNDTLAIGNVNPTTLTDNDGGLDHTAFAVGDYVYSDADGSPAFFEVASISAPNIVLQAPTVALAAGDIFGVRHNLPDPNGQEDSAILLYTGTATIKQADFNWEIANALYLTSGYAAQNGTIAPSEDLDSAISKLDGNQQDIQTASGISQGDTNYGTWTSPVDLLLSATATAKELFQRFGVLLMQLRGVEVTGITAQTMVDQVPVASVCKVVWMYCAKEDATPANRESGIISALNDGSTGEDHTSPYAKNKVGSNFNFDIDVDISGGNMRLLATSSTAGVTVTVRRIEVVKSVL